MPEQKLRKADRDDEAELRAALDSGRGELLSPKADSTNKSGLWQRWSFIGDWLMKPSRCRSDSIPSPDGALALPRRRLGSPQSVQLHRHTFERCSLDRVLAAVRGEQQPASVVQRKNFERLGEWIDEPKMGDSGSRVDRHFPSAIGSARRGREDFADPVWSERKERFVRCARHACAAPSGEVGHDNVLAEVKFGFVDDPPASRASVTKLKRWTKRGTDCGRRDSVTRRRPRTDHQLSVQDFTYDILGKSEDVFVGGWTPNGHRHLPTLARFGEL